MRLLNTGTRSRAMKTPDEARKCVCPHRVTAATKLYIERGINPWEYMECQADKCMMWRWEPSPLAEDNAVFLEGELSIRADNIIIENIGGHERERPTFSELKEWTLTSRFKHYTKNMGKKTQDEKQAFVDRRAKELSRVKQEKSHGYCGLAGKP